MRLSKAAAILDVSIETLKRWIYEGKIHGVKTPGGQWRVYKDEIMALIGEVEPEDYDRIKDEEDSVDSSGEVIDV